MRTLLTICIASVWLISGLYCKLLDYVPRHQEIVARILGNEYAPFLTNIIGLCEVFLGIFILMGYHSKQIAILQVFLITLMGIIGIIMVPDLLLFGRYNGLLSLAFCFLILYTEFYMKRKTSGTGYGLST